MKIYTYQEDIHDSYDPDVTLKTLAQLEKTQRSVITDAIKEQEGTDDFDTLAEIAELERLLSENDIDQAWEVFTEGFDGNEPMVKHPDDFYHVQEHEMPEVAALEARAAMLEETLRDVAGQCDADCPAEHRSEGLRTSLQVAFDLLDPGTLYKEIDEHITEQAVKDGDCLSSEAASDYRIVP